MEITKKILILKQDKKGDRHHKNKMNSKEFICRINMNVISMADYKISYGSTNFN